MNKILYVLSIVLSSCCQINANFFSSVNTNSNDILVSEKCYSEYYKNKPEDIGQFLTIFFKKNSVSSVEVQSVIKDLILADYFSEKLNKHNRQSSGYYTKAINTAEKLNRDDLVLWTNINYAFYLYIYRHLRESFPFFMTSIEKAGSLSAKQTINPTDTYKKLGYFLTTSGEYTEAEAFLFRAVASAADKKSELATLFDALGICYLRQNQVIKAEQYFRKSIQFSKEGGDWLRFAKSLGNIGELRILQKRYDDAVVMLELDVDYSQRAGNLQNTMYAKTLLGRVYLKKNDIQNALVNLKSADSIARANPYFKSSMLEIRKLLLKIAIRNGNTQEELKLRRNIDQLNSDLENMDGKGIVDQVSWETEKSNLKLRIASAETKREKESVQKTAAIVCCFLLFGLGVFTIRSYRHKIKVRKTEYEKKVMQLEIDKMKSEKRLNATHVTLESYRVFLSEKNRQIEQLEHEMAAIGHTSVKYLKENTTVLEKLLESHLMTAENWENFKAAFYQEYPQYFRYLKENFPDLTDSNLRMILLTKLELTNQETARILAVTVDAVKKSKQRLRKKYGSSYEDLFTDPGLE